MSAWRPSPAIRVKVLGLAWRGDELLLGEVEASDGRVKGFRPLGGAIEFGETREEALRREFHEELGCAVSIEGPWHVFENLYEHEGARGHEVIFAADIRLGDPRLYETDRFQFVEDEGTGCWATWAAPSRLPSGVALYPAGLLAIVKPP